MKVLGSIKRNLILIILLSIAISFFIIKDDFVGITTKLINLNWWWIFGAISLLLGWIIFMALSMQVLVTKFKPKYRFVDAIQNIWIINFMAAVTPGSAGGHPTAVYTLHKQNIKLNEATHLAFLHFIIYQIAFIIITTIAIGANLFFDYFQDDFGLKLIIAVCYLLNFLILLGLVLITYNEKINKWVFTRGISFLAKLKFVKDAKVTTEKWHGYIENFIMCGKDMRKDTKRVVIGTIYYIISLTCLMAVPYFCIKGVDPQTTITLSIALVIACYIAIISTYVPIPGSTGGIEVAYLFFYTKFVASSTNLSTSLLLYRMLSYHLIILIGGLAFISFEHNQPKKRININ